MRHDGPNIRVKWILCAVVQTKCVASVHDSSGMIKREHGVRPVKVWCHDKLQHMTTTKVGLVTTLHCLLLDFPVSST